MVTAMAHQTAVTIASMWQTQTKQMPTELLARGANINHQNAHGNTALHYSSLRDHTAFSMMCVSEFKASVLIPNNANELAMEVAQTARLSLRPRQGAALEA